MATDEPGTQNDESAANEPPRAVAVVRHISLWRELLTLARRDRTRANRRAVAFSLKEQVEAVCEAPLELRSAVLDLLPAPEQVVPQLPEAELCFLCKHLGVHDSSWLLAVASDEQIVACLDLDAWRGPLPDLHRLDGWMATLAEAGDATLLRAVENLDPELVALYLREHIEVDSKPPGDESWQPPDSSQTLEGQFYFVARHEGDDLAPLKKLLHVLFEGDYWLYFRMLQSVDAELQSDLEEWALRWRTGRLEDMGFPTWDNAMRIYGFLRPERLAQLPREARPLDVSAWALPIWISELPATSTSGHSVFRAASRLEPDERRAFFYAFVALANRVAVADRLDLGDAKTLPLTIEKAAQVASRGLDHLSVENDLGPVEALRQVSLEQLFRVGVNLAPEDTRPPFSGENNEEAVSESAGGE